MSTHRGDGARTSEDAARSHSVSWLFSDAAVSEAIKLLEDTDLIPQLCDWREAERLRLGHHPGGIPERFPPEALWVPMILAVLNDQPQLVTTYYEILFHRISPKMRARLSVPDPPDDHDHLGRNALYRDLRTRFHGMLEAIDPSDLPKNRRLPSDPFEAAVARRRAEHQLTDEVLRTRYERLTWVLNTILEASLKSIPRSIRRHYRGSAALDATPIPAFARQDRRQSGRRPRHERSLITQSADPDAGLYVRTEDDEGRSLARGEKDLKTALWAFEATIVVAGTDDAEAEQPFPSVVLGMAPLHRPATDVGPNAITALTSVAARGYPRHRLAADRAYTNCMPEKFQLPARALGYELVLDYKIDQLGVQESFKGAKLVEGARYCAGLPDVLANATLDFRNGDIDEATWRTRIAERLAYRTRPKANPDEQGHVREMCPASPGAPTASCELKSESLVDAAGKTRIPVTDELRAFPPTICSQNSVTFPPDAGAKYLQPLHYGSDEWAQVYGTLRNTVEGMNGIAKDGAHSALGDPTRRRVRGVAAQSIFAALAFFATNIRKVRSFIRTAIPDTAGVLRKPRPARRKTTPIGAWKPEGLARSGDPPP
jgi:hypothetical protein